MAIDVIEAAAFAEQQHLRRYIEAANDLRSLVKAVDLDGAESDTLRLVSEIKQFLEWCDDPLPQFSDDVEGEDKFARLIDIARSYQECTSFFVSEVGVNSSTVWRWATDKSRPTRYVGKRVSQEVAEQVAVLLLQKAHDKGLGSLVADQRR